MPGRHDFTFDLGPSSAASLNHPTTEAGQGPNLTCQAHGASDRLPADIVVENRDREGRHRVGESPCHVEPPETKLAARAKSEGWSAPHMQSAENHRSSTDVLLDCLAFACPGEPSAHAVWIDVVDSRRVGSTAARI